MIVTMFDFSTFLLQSLLFLQVLLWKTNSFAFIQTTTSRTPTQKSSALLDFCCCHNGQPQFVAKARLEQQQQKNRYTSSSSFYSRDKKQMSVVFSSSSDFIAESTTKTVKESEVLIQLAKEFLYTQSGFYSPVNETVFSNEFVFRGPIVGPLNKDDYIRVMDTFQIYDAVPDINPNAFGYTIDPIEPTRVWFFVRNTGTFTGTKGLGLGYGLSVPSNNKTINGCVETFSITFDDDCKVKYLTVGYVADRFIGNTGGYGAAFGIFHAVGLPLPKGPILRTFQYIASEILDSPAKTYSVQNLPTWWTSPFKASDGM